MRTIEQSTLRLPCESYEYPKTVITTIFEVDDYGRSKPRGLVVHEGEVWIVSRGRGDYWRLETKVSDVVAHQCGGRCTADEPISFSCGSNFMKWRNYLRRIVRWPWKEEDTKEIIDASR